MSDGAEQNDNDWAGVLGPVYDRVIRDADVYLAGENDLLIPAVNVTLRESAGVAGWVGVVDADLTPYADFKLELRLPDQTAECGVMFTIGGDIFGRTLIRGTGPLPGDTPKDTEQTQGPAQTPGTPVEPPKFPMLLSGNRSSGLILLQCPGSRPLVRLSHVLQGRPSSDLGVSPYPAPNLCSVGAENCSPSPTPAGSAGGGAAD